MKFRFFFNHQFLILLLFYSLSSEANEYIAESDFFGESPIVLTVSRMNKPLAESPASVTVIDRQMIRNSGARQIADIFRLVPGFIVGYQSGNIPVVTYQGLGHQWHRQMQVLIDGRSVFIPSFGGVSWSNLPLLLEDIERVEVTRGPNAVTYGANAFLATINIITRHASEDVGGMLSYAHDLDSDRTAQDLYVRYGDQHDDLDWRISAGREKDDGYRNLNDSRLSEKLNIRTDFQTAYNQFWTVQAGINQSTLGRGSGSESNIIRDEEITNSYQNIKWELLQDQVNTTILFTHTRQTVKDNFESDPLNDFLATLNPALAPQLALITEDIITDINIDRTSDRTDFEAYQSRTLNKKITVVYGGSVRKDKVKSFYLFNDNQQHDVDTNRLFSSIEWKPLSGLIIDVGLMLEDTNFTGRETSYRLSVIKNLGPHNLRFVNSTARRNPILWELIGKTQFETDIPAPIAMPITVVILRATGNVEPENIRSSEIGLFSEYLNRTLSSDIKLFSYKITDQITEEERTLSPDPLTGLDQTFEIFENKETTKVDGFEISFNFTPQHKNYRLYGGLSLTDVESARSGLQNSFPQQSAFISGHFDLSLKHQVSGALYAVDNISWVDEADDIDAYQRLDIRYQYIIDQDSDTRVELIGYNLLDDYFEYSNDHLQEELLLLRISGRF